MDHVPTDVKTESEEPKDDEHNDNGPKHKVSLNSELKRR